MKNAFVALCLTLTPAMAQDAPVPAPEVEEGWTLMERGAKLLFEGLMTEIEPALDEMGEAVAGLEPQVRSLLTMLGDFRNYHAPEKLKNGDILIRRKTPAELHLEGLKGLEMEL